MAEKGERQNAVMPSFPQVKKKMTCEEFIRNNRGINGGADLPHGFLRELYGSISENEIRISADQQQHAASMGSGGLIVSPVLWTGLAQQAQTPRGHFAYAAGAQRRCLFLQLTCERCSVLQWQSMCALAGPSSKPCLDSLTWHIRSEAQLLLLCT
jgi:hypothetical protein